MPLQPAFLHPGLVRSRRRGTRRPLRSDETGAETVEFALLAPAVMLLLAGILYFLFAVAAQVSLHHATSVGARFATIPTDPVETTYPSTQEVEDRVAASTPFFTADSCTTTVDGDDYQNAPVSLDVTCAFPNPLGALMNGIGDTFFDDVSQDTSFDMSARATARRE